MNLFPAVVIISWLGILAGFLLGRATQEEVAHGKRWLIWLQRATWLCVAAILAWIFDFRTVETVVIAVVFLAIILFEHQIPEPIKQLILAISISLTLRNTLNAQALAMMGSAIFIHFLAKGISVIPAKATKAKVWHLGMKKLTRSVTYPLAALLLFFITVFF